MRELADATEVDAGVRRLAEAVRGWMAHEPGSWALVGVRRRGDDLARRLAEVLGTDQLLGVGSLDITLYRDDLSEIGPAAIVGQTDVPFALDGVQVVLVDDVLMTGRTVRAALSCLRDHGRARRVWLAVLVDRGGRQLPIAADAASWTLDVSHDEVVKVMLRPTDDQDAVSVEARS